VRHGFAAGPAAGGAWAGVLGGSLVSAPPSAAGVAAATPSVSAALSPPPSEFSSTPSSMSARTRSSQADSPTSAQRLFDRRAERAARLIEWRARHASPSPGGAAPSPARPLSDADLARLRAFDLAQPFGPCIGPTRLQRWRRADLWGLEPPQEVFGILMRLEADDPEVHCLWRNHPL
jgi:DNA polymerase delta subunit 4